MSRENAEKSLERLAPTSERVTGSMSVYRWDVNQARYVEVVVHCSGELRWEAKFGSDTQSGFTICCDPIPQPLVDCIKRMS